MINVRIRCKNNLPELKTKGYSVIIKGFRKYKFICHHRVQGSDNLWVITEVSSGIAFNGGFETRLQAAENAYYQLMYHKKEFVKKIQEFKFEDK